MPPVKPVDGTVHVTVTDSVAAGVRVTFHLYVPTFSSIASLWGMLAGVSARVGVCVWAKVAPAMHRRKNASEAPKSAPPPPP